MRYVLFALLMRLLATVGCSAADYPIVAIRSERPDDETWVRFAEVMNPIHHPVSDLVVIQPDGTEEVLVSGNGTDAILDPKTLDGVNVFFARIYDVEDTVQGHMPISKRGSDIFSIDIATGEITQWTDQTDEPLASFGFVTPNNHEPYNTGVFNLGPQPLPDGRLVYTSNRRRIDPTKGFTKPCLQLHVRHPDGRVECIAPMSQGSALHPELLRDGRIAFSSYESMGLRDIRAWSLWQIHPDGTNWGPILSAYDHLAFHFHTQRTSGQIVCTEYYNLNNNGFGTLMACDEYPPEAAPAFSHPDTPYRVQQGYSANGNPIMRSYIFAASGLANLMPWAHPQDSAATAKASKPELAAESVTGDYMGKMTHPSAAPDNAILMTFSSGPATYLTRPENRPTVHCEIRRLVGDVADSPDDLELIHKRDGYNYTQPRALVSHEEIYQMPAVALPIKTDYSKSYGVFGSSSAFEGEWTFDSGSTGEPESLVIIGTEPNIAKLDSVDARGRWFSSGSTGWSNGLNERLRILGEYKFDQPGRPEGDSSFRVKLPAGVPFTAAIRGDDGRFITFGESWKQVMPGYSEHNCGKCHGHGSMAIPWQGKFAFEDDYVLRDFTGDWQIPEFSKDVKPIIEQHCSECHDGNTATELNAMTIRQFAKPLQAGKSALSHRIRGEHGLDQMPLGREPLSTEQIHTIDEWIDMGCLIDDGSGAAFDVFSQVANPNPVDEPLPVVPDPEPDPPSDSEIIRELRQTLIDIRARINEVIE